MTADNRFKHPAARAFRRAAAAAAAAAHPVVQTKDGHEDKFRQLDEVWPTPGETRTGAGAPGESYWQQFVRYEIAVTLDDPARRVSGIVTIAYENRSPDTLRYLWLQLDQNRFKPHSVSQLGRDDPASERLPFARLREIMMIEESGLGYEIAAVRDARGRPLAFTIVDTMMRVDLPEPLRPGETVRFAVEFAFDIVPAKELSNRTAFEILDDGSPNYFIAMWYPRMAAYTDYGGWIVKSFLYGEPALEFADFSVAITVPESYLVAATGVLDNPREVLGETERQRLEQARTAERPVFIVTPEEAVERAARQDEGTRTWRFEARNVRDFAFAASPAFIWDAIGHETADGRTVLAQSFYPPEGMPLWDLYSTEAVVQALETYGRMAGPYPWPHATSVNAPIRSGMEYPMLAANAPRPEKDGTYSRRRKYGLIGVVVHEVGHNWFPMIVNSDERHWLWMDEGLNSFVDELAMREWEEDAPDLRGEPRNFAAAMTAPDQVPVMTQSDAYINRGRTGYGKVAAALNILRETVLGRDLFDFAFREYARRWWFKRPQPADFFRTMEDASGVDLDWFWRGWFYTTDHVDIAIERVTLATVDTEDPDIEAAYGRAEEAAKPAPLTELGNAGIARRVEGRPWLRDFYNAHDAHTVTPEDREGYVKLLEGLEAWERGLLESGANLYFVEFANKGGLVMPLILKIAYGDGSSEEMRIPAEIWRTDQQRVTKLIVTAKEIASITLDPRLETADADLSDNHWPRQSTKTRIELFKQKREKNLMQKMGTEPEE